MSTETRELIIPAGHARLWRMRAGERVTIVQTEGHQVGVFISSTAAAPTESLSPSHTRRCLNRISIGLGHSLYTNHREPIVDVVEDTVGVHDILAAACDPYRYRRDFGLGNPPRPRLDFVGGLAEHAIPDSRAPRPAR